MKRITLLAPVIIAGCITAAQGQGPNTVPASGNVGVGLAAPTAKLDISLPATAPMESGLRVTAPSPFIMPGSEIESLFHIRRTLDLPPGERTEFVVKNNGRVGMGAFEPKSVVDRVLD